MKSCVVKSCKNYMNKFKKLQGITYHEFPRNEDRKDEWVRVIRNCRGDIDWKPSTASTVCSAHFDDADFITTAKGLRCLRPHAIPKKLLLSNHPKIQKQKTPSTPTILQESSNVEGVAKDPLRSTSLSTISTLSQSQVPVFEKVFVKEELIVYCRFCAASDCDGELLNLQSDDALRKLVVKMVKRLNTNIDFNQEHLPTTICSACVKALYTAYDFVVGIDQAQITLNNKLIQKDIHQMPGNRNLDNNLDSSSTSLQQISTNEGTEANDFEQKPLLMPSTSFLLPQVPSNNEVAASDFEQPLLPVSNTTVPLIQVSTNNGPAISKIEQPLLESSSNLLTLLDSAEKRLKYSFDLDKERQKIDRQRKKLKTLNQKIRRLQKRNELLKKKLITLRKNNTDANQAKKLSSNTYATELFNNMDLKKKGLSGILKLPISLNSQKSNKGKSQSGL